jgi:uncharacterized membrane protein
MSPGPLEEKTLKVETVISQLLYWGVLGSLVLIAGGTLLCFIRSGDYGNGGGAAPDLRRLLVQGPAFPRAASWLGQGLADLNGTAIIVAGLLLLILTPVMRVAISIFAFAVGRDRIYVAITSVVLALLLASFFLGKAG